MAGCQCGMTANSLYAVEEVLIDKRFSGDRYSDTTLSYERCFM